MGRKRGELTLAEKNAIISLSEAKVNGIEISRICKLPRSTIYSFLKRYRERESMENRHRSGRPKSISAQGNRQILRLVRENRRRSLKEITNILNETGPLSISESTVKRNLYRQGFHRRIVKKKMRVRDVNKKKRLLWCRRERSKTVDEYWNKVIFSDECKVEIGGDQRVYVWRKAGEEWDPPCIAPPPVKRLSLMVWGCVTYNGVGTLCVVNGNINAGKYIETLENNLWPVVVRHFLDGNFIFQDDNAPVHRARIVKTYMENNNINVMEWPAQSPDINIIENCWGKLKRELQNHVQNITTEADLEAAIRTVWENIPINFIQELYQSIPRRLTRVIKSKGCLTKY